MNQAMIRVSQSCLGYWAICIFKINVHQWSSVIFSGRTVYMLPVFWKFVSYFCFLKVSKDDVERIRIEKYFVLHIYLGWDAKLLSGWMTNIPTVIKKDYSSCIMIPSLGCSIYSALWPLYTSLHSCISRFWTHMYERGTRLWKFAPRVFK